jgi:hypothetical protein
VAVGWENRNMHRNLAGKNLKEIHLKGLGVNGNVISKWMLKGQNGGKGG